MMLLVLALAVLILPPQWLIAIVLAAVIHELCHYLAIRCCGGQIIGISVGMGGARIEVVGLSNGQELFCALAGPLGGLALLLLIRWIPRTAICGAFQSLFNLLPVYPLDGGRALQCGMELILPMERVDCVCLWVRRISLGLILGLGVYGTVFLGLGLMPLLLAVIIFGKIACKPDRH